MKRFGIFSINWIASKLAIPFCVVGHVHLTMNIYEVVYEIISSFWLNILVAIGFWIEWKNNIKQNRI